MKTIAHDGLTGEGCIETGELFEAWTENGRNVVALRASERSIVSARPLVLIDRTTREILAEANDVDAAILACEVMGL